jgi:hypothetical protein
MTNQQHPITPPPVILQQLRSKAPTSGWHRDAWIAEQAAQWGADQELEACLSWLQARIREGWNPWHLEDLRNARRPKPPSLKEQALTALKDMDLSLDDGHNASIIRQALEQLND